jgi:putative RecB family exonuclease
VPLVNQETGELLEPELMVVLDLIERDREGRLVVVDLKTASRKYTDIQVETSLQVLTKTKEPELVRYRTTRDRAANLRLFRLADEVTRAVGANLFPPVVGWQCKECQFKERWWAWR